MYNVTITYKSGKIENTQIAMNDYSAALKQLMDEQRLVSMVITGVE
jgi:hypothetical protein